MAIDARHAPPRRPHARSVCAALPLATVLAACGASVVRCAPGEAAPANLAPVDDGLARAFADVPFHSKKAARSLSDVAPLAGGELLLVSDEGTELGLARPGEKGRTIDVLSAFPAFAEALGGKPPKEIDYESAAADQGTLVVVGSASLKREKPEGSAAQLHEIKLASGEGKPHSNYLLELRAGPGAEITLAKSLDVRRALLADPLLEPFSALPSKENGLDVEGVALRGRTVYLGLRGPVLRGHAIVASLDLDAPEPRPALHFLALEGLGVRSLCRAAAGGFWVLAGPTLDVADPFVLFHWDGEGSVLDAADGSHLRRAADVAHAPGDKPEGLFERGGQLCVVHDGPTGGAPRCRPIPSLR
jgi:Protein of unknown function (DUF3616)